MRLANIGHLMRPTKVHSICLLLVLTLFGTKGLCQVDQEAKKSLLLGMNNYLSTLEQQVISVSGVVEDQGRASANPFDPKSTASDYRTRRTFSARFDNKLGQFKYDIPKSPTSQQLVSREQAWDGQHSWLIKYEGASPASAVRICAAPDPSEDFLTPDIFLPLQIAFGFSTTEERYLPKLHENFLASIISNADSISSSAEGTYLVKVRNGDNFISAEFRDSPVFHCVMYKRESMVAKSNAVITQQCNIVYANRGGTWLPEKGTRLVLRRTDKGEVPSVVNLARYTEMRLIPAQGTSFTPILPSNIPITIVCDESIVKSPTAFRVWIFSLVAVVVAVGMLLVWRSGILGRERHVR